MRTQVAVLLVLGVAACRPKPQGPAVGAPSARGAVESFLAAVRAQDLQAMSNFWGSTTGPARDRIERTELEKRELTMTCYLAHDRLRFLDEMPGTGGRRSFTVELSYGTVTRTTSVTTVQGPSARWYVEDVDIRATQALCEARNRPKS